jgi:hypothetical protein
MGLDCASDVRPDTSENRIKGTSSDLIISNESEPVLELSYRSVNCNA